MKFIRFSKRYCSSKLADHRQLREPKWYVGSLEKLFLCVDKHAPCVINMFAFATHLGLLRKLKKKTFACKRYSQVKSHSFWWRGRLAWIKNTSQYGKQWNFKNVRTYRRSLISMPSMSTKVIQRNIWQIVSELYTSRKSRYSAINEIKLPCGNSISSTGFSWAV